ncbi:MAG: phosphoribosyltransferase [Peptococcaceae bacterium]|jgi:predicted phosphoribosyltransferase|nr:MAG: phosphoribosyltransferase [Peptococcaceae bacterium]
MVFKDRTEAGKRLAAELSRWAFPNGLVIAVPRGGVVIGAEVARSLGLKLDLIIPRKLGAPHNPELALGAVTQDGTTILNRGLSGFLQLEDKELQYVIEREIKEIKRRMILYRGSEDYPDCKDKQLIITDDGIATGYTMLAALRSLKKFEPEEITLAVPVAPPDTLTMLQGEVSRVVCLLVPENFYAVGQFYRDFEQTSDDEVINILRELKR